MRPVDPHHLPPDPLERALALAIYALAVLVVAYVILVATCRCAHAADLPADPALRCATKALRGDYGPLQEWQRVGYTQFLTHGPTWRRVWGTTYYPAEGFRRGQVCRWWGAGCSERVVAANRLPARSWVWCAEAGLRQVLDTGSPRNDRVADRRGLDLWVDWWEPRRGQTFGDDCVWGMRVATAPARGASQ